MTLGRILGTTRLSRTFTLAIVAMLTVLSLIVAWISLSTHRAANEHAMERHWRMTGSVTSAALSNSALSDLTFVEDFVSQLGREPGVDSVVIHTVRQDGSVTRGFDENGLHIDDRPTTDALVLDCLSTGDSIFTIDEEVAGDAGRRAHLAFPISANNQIWGVGRVDISAEHLDRLSEDLMERLGILTLAFMLAGVVAGIVLARYVVGPVERLSAAAVRVAAGDLDVVVDVRRDDEVGDLGRAFARMVESLRSAHGDLRRARGFVEDVYASMVEALIVVEPENEDDWTGPLRVRSVNRAACAMLTLSEPELLSMNLAQLLPSDSLRLRVAHSARRRIAVADIEAELLTHDGRPIPVRITATPLQRSGEVLTNCEEHSEETCYCLEPPAALVLVARDLSDLHRVERVRRAGYEIAAASQHASTLDELFASVHSVLTSLMPADHFSIAVRDRQTGAILDAYNDGPARDEIEIKEGLIPYAMEQLVPVLLDGTHIRGLLGERAVSRDVEVPVAWLGVPLRASERSIGLIVLESRTPGRVFSEEDVKLLGFVSDQVARAIVQRREEEERARLSAAVEHAADGIVLTDATRAVEYVNAAFQRLSGWSLLDARGKDLLALGATKADIAARQQVWMAVLRDGSWTGRMQSRRKDGSLYEADVSISCVRDEDGNVVHYVSVEHDVTNVVALETQLRQAQKMEAVGKLAGGIAHDFNNLLSVINGYSAILLSGMDETAPDREHIEEILRAGERAAGLTRQLLAFSRRQVLKPCLLDLNTVVADAEKMLRRLIGEDVELHTLLDPGAGRVEADPGQIEQVVMNLAVNARDAMPRGGKLTLETGVRFLDAEYCAHHAELKPGAYVLLAMTDTGHGMDTGTLARIFEPFFTTKELGQGTGLGLSTVYGIVKQSGGHVSVYSEAGRGTCFRIYLPRVGAGDADDDDAATLSPVPTGQETVLVAEDEAGVRQLASLLLRRAGYHVLQAEDGESALRVAATHDGPIHLLLTDVVMPRMSGRELWDALSGVRTEMRVLYMSGYTDAAIVHHGVLEPGTPFLEKPFVPDNFLAVVRQVIDGVHAALLTE